MYEQHFGLNEQPFGLTPNTQFFLNAQGHREAFNMLQVALANGEGFIKVVGEVGAGKTMLCRKLLNSLDENFYTAYIPNPFLDPISLYKAVAEELGVNCKNNDGINEYQQAINVRLIEFAEGRGRKPKECPVESYVDGMVSEDVIVTRPMKVVLVIDEAQAMPIETLEAVRLISNFETETTKLIHIVLFGQPELDELLANDRLRQLRQRITFSCTIPPLDCRGVRNYINHRVNTAGYNGDQLFSEDATKLLYRVSNGIPRLVNILCHKALMCAYGKGAGNVSKGHMVVAIDDTDGVKVPSFFNDWAWVFSLVLMAGLMITMFFIRSGNQL